MKRAPKHHTRAFTLIEMLVVIAIIALLVAIILPALGRARLAGWKTVSLSNIRQITTAAHAYREDNKQYMPVMATYRRGQSTTNVWSTWPFGGKNCHGDWASLYGGVYDVLAADRPLNAYMYPEVDVYAPAAPMSLSPLDPTRKTLELPGFRDPSDRESFQRSADLYNRPVASPISSYDDVGTSYHLNMKWLGHITTGSVEQAFRLGADRMRLADTFAASRFVWINDQYADIAANNINAGFRVTNGFREINKSVLGYLDGHASYVAIRPGQAAESYSNSEYTFVFEDLRAR